MSLDKPDNSNANSEPGGLEASFCEYIMQELLPEGCGITVNPEDDLLTIGYLDSMQFMRLVQYTEESYALKIPAEDLLIENFQTVRLLASYVAGRLNTVEQ